MGQETGISWCDATFNPWLGCSKVSPGCAHCYALDIAKGRMGIDVWDDSPRRVTADSTWKKPRTWERYANDGKLPNGEKNRDGHRPRVFCASMADVFEELDELEEPRLRLFDLIAETPALDWLVLTKRPEFAAEWLDFRYHAMGDGEPLPNVWLGTSVENQRFTWRADALRDAPAAVRFISAEPLLGSLLAERVSAERLGPDGDSRSARNLSGPLAGSVKPDAEDALRQRDEGSTPSGSIEIAAPDSGLGERPARPSHAALEGDSGSAARAPLDLSGIDWLIVGGESGPKARPMQPEWARELRDAAVELGIAFHFKQWGGRTSKAGGKVLDGVEWCEFPEREAVFA